MGEEAAHRGEKKKKKGKEVEGKLPPRAENGKPPAGCREKKIQIFSSLPVGGGGKKEALLSPRYYFSFSGAKRIFSPLLHLPKKGKGPNKLKRGKSSCLKGHSFPQEGGNISSESQFSYQKEIAPQNGRKKREVTIKFQRSLKITFFSGGGGGGVSTERKRANSSLKEEVDIQGRKGGLGRGGFVRGSQSHWKKRKGLNRLKPKKKKKTG